MVRFSWVSMFVSVTDALPMAAPLVSVTTPVIDPYTFWPHPAFGVSARATTTVKISASFLRFGISFLRKKLSDIRDICRTDAPADGDGFCLGNTADNMGNHKKTIMTPQLVPYLGPRVAIVKHNFDILYEMNQEI